MQSFKPNKLSLNNFRRENAKNALKPLKLKLARNLKHMTIDFDSKNLYQIVLCAKFHAKQKNF